MAAHDEKELLLKKHIKFFTRCLQVLPGQYGSLDTSRMTVAFFAISGLDMCKSLHVLDREGKEKYIEWIYSLQVLPNSSGSNLDQCGFRGSPTVGNYYDPVKASQDDLVYDSGHIAMTYTALLSLLILGDDLSRIDRKAILSGLRKLQLPDGSFCPIPEGAENDMRFVYCACCISYILDDWSGMDVNRAVRFITNSLSHEGAIGQGPGLEAHGGSNYCALASLVLMGHQPEDVFSKQQMTNLKRWCIMRQQSGFQGRPNKPVDTCYSFWVGASLKLLGIYDLSDARLNRCYLMQTQDPLVGGFAKWPGNSPDPLHTYFGICGLALMGESSVRDMHPALNISQRASDHLYALQRKESPRKAPVTLLRDKHIMFFQQCLKGLPEQHVVADTSRLTIAYFAVSGLDLLGAIDSVDKNKLIQWIYSLQLTPNGNEEQSDCGFRGAASAITNVGDNDFPGSKVDGSHLAMTYSALCCLLILGDSFENLDRPALLRSVTKLQKPCGSFSAAQISSQTDMKFSYCATAVCYMLGQTDIMDQDGLTRYIMRSLSHEGGFAQGPDLEAHGGATYCAISSLMLMDRFASTLTKNQQDQIRRWCLSKQQDGFSSRTNRDTDSSYSFWIGATLMMLDSLEMSNVEENMSFLLQSQSSSYGGFAEKPNQPPDVMHTYFSLCGLALLKHESIMPIDPLLNISQRARDHLEKLLQKSKA